MGFSIAVTTGSAIVFGLMAFFVARLTLRAPAENAPGFPMPYRVFGGFFLFMALVIFLVLAVIFVKSPAGFAGEPFSQILFLVFLCSLFVWLVATAGAWFFGLPSSFGFLYLSQVILTALCAILYTIFFRVKGDEDSRIWGSVLISLPGMLLLFMLLTMLYGPVRRHAVLKGYRGLVPILPFSLFGAFVLLPILGLTLYQKFGTHYQRASTSGVTTSGEMDGYPASNAKDLSVDTWWTPQPPHGIGSWITVNMYGSEEISGVDIHPGSHAPNHPQYGNLFLQNSRIMDAELMLDGGKKIPLHFEDADEVQRFTFAPAKTHSVKLFIKTTRKGSKWNDLCVSEFAPLAKNRPFRED